MFMASAVVRWVVPNYTSFGRGAFRFLGKRRTATKSLKGRLVVAQPPSATMAVTDSLVGPGRAHRKSPTKEKVTKSGQGSLKKYATRLRVRRKYYRDKSASYP